MIYLPSSELRDKLESLVQGFIIANDPKLVICIKLEPSLQNSIIKGCPVEVGIIKSDIRRKGMMLLVEDIPGEPFFVVGENFGDEHTKYEGYDFLAIELMTQKELILALFNLDGQPIYSRKIKLENNLLIQPFALWIHQNSSNHKDLRRLSENDIFFINIENYSEKELHRDISFINIKPDMEVLINDGKYEPIVTKDNLFLDGKHGYTQEDALRNVLYNFFVKDFNCFISPKKIDGTELIDAMLILEEFIVLIESKYVISDKPTNKTQAINKAISQLDQAEKYLLENDVVNYKLITNKKIIKFVLGDSRLFNKMPKSIFNSKTNLPIFISITSFTQLLGVIYVENKDDFYQAFENQLLWFLEVNQPNKLCIF